MFSIVIGPDSAPADTETVSFVVVALVTLALMPLLNRTILLEAIALKFVPLIVITVPACPLTGLNEVMVGTCANTFKLNNNNKAVDTAIRCFLITRLYKGL